MTQPLQQFLGSNTLAGLHEHAQRLQRLQAAVARMLPGNLSRGCAVANYKQETLILTARSGAAATRLKQMLPSLIQRLQADGHAVQHIRIKVSIAQTPRPPAPAKPRTLGRQGRESLIRLRDSLPADEPLRQSLQRLLERSR